MHRAAFMADGRQYVCISLRASNHFAIRIVLSRLLDNKYCFYLFLADFPFCSDMDSYIGLGRGGKLRNGLLSYQYEGIRV